MDFKEHSTKELNMLLEDIKDELKMNISKDTFQRLISEQFEIEAILILRNN